MPKTIFVVDDELVIREISKRRLEEAGYTVVVAQDGQEALDALKTKIPDLILLDIQMPNMNGYTFMTEKSKTPAFVNIPVIVLTAYAEMEPLFKRHGVLNYILKPIKLHDVLEKVQEAIGPAS